MRNLHAIASEIGENWIKMSYSARPYWLAMFSIKTIDQNYHNDSGRSIVTYFLANAGTWKGETAKRIKKELKDMLK